MVNSCFSVAVFSICAVIFSVLLRQYCREQSLMISLAACSVVLGAFVYMLSPVIQQIETLFGEAGISSEYISLVFKAAAVCFITQITCEICRDSGENAIASAAELWGRGAITIMAVPIIQALVKMITDFL